MTVQVTIKNDQSTGKSIAIYTLDQQKLLSPENVPDVERHYKTLKSNESETLHIWNDRQLIIKEIEE